MYLGVIIHVKLSWDPHAEVIITKAARKIGALWRRALSGKSRRMFIQAAIMPDFLFIAVKRILCRATWPPVSLPANTALGSVWSHSSDSSSIVHDKQGPGFRVLVGFAFFSFQEVHFPPTDPLNLKFSQSI